MRNGVRCGGGRVRGGDGGARGAAPSLHLVADGALARQGRPARQLQRQGRGEGAAREVPHGQVRLAPDGPHPQAARRRDVALRRATEALRYTGGFWGFSLSMLEGVFESGLGDRGGCLWSFRDWGGEKI